MTQKKQINKKVETFYRINARCLLGWLSHASTEENLTDTKGRYGRLMGAAMWSPLARRDVDVLKAVITLMNDDGICKHGRATISRLSRYDAKSVSRALQVLVKLGLVTELEPSEPGGKIPRKVNEDAVAELRSKPLDGYEEIIKSQSERIRGRQRKDAGLRLETMDTMSIGGDTMSIGGDTMSIGGDTMSIGGDTMSIGGDTMSTYPQRRQPYSPYTRRGRAFLFLL